MAVSETMTAARMHTVGGELKLEKLPTPKPGDMDVLIRVKACGIVPNLGNILANWPTWFPHMPQPPLPAVFGLDPAGEIAAVGRQVHGLKPGDMDVLIRVKACGIVPNLGNILANWPTWFPHMPQPPLPA
ncbi:MAG: alcohol dehydrogenase catalytic domain-containing protein, partial [Tardiphaga sp.]